MTKCQARQHAQDIVWQMLNGRCCPEVSDVDDITEDPEEQEAIIESINVLLRRLSKTLKPTCVIR